MDWLTKAKRRHTQRTGQGATHKLYQPLDMDLYAGRRVGIYNTILFYGEILCAAPEGMWAHAKRVSEAVIFGVYDQFDAYFDHASDQLASSASDDLD